MTFGFSVLVLAWFALGWLGRCSGQAVTGTPLVVAPSGNWDGGDGPWSTFNLAVGNPVQLFRCIPGISSPVVILSAQSNWCDDTCYEEKTFFDSGSSKTWKTAGLYTIPQELNEYISGYDDVEEGDAGAAVWGIDDVYLGKTAKDRNISSQYIALTTQKKFHVGTFGLSPGSVGPPGAVQSTFLSSLWDSKVIPSQSFSYTAGSAMRNTSGSLVLGGYDTSRFDPTTTLSWAMPNKQNTSLIVSMDAISIADAVVWKPRSGESASSSATFTIDSAVPQIWLPEEACVLFETTFGLIWDDSLKLYLVNDTTHTRLLSESPEVRFSLKAGEQSVNYTLPYSAFDLKLTYPFVNASTYYFPLKRASGPMQYMLGRTFLQETYITVDYERSNFSLSQAYPDGSSAYIIAIAPVSEPTQISDPPLLPPSNNSKHLSSAAYAGIGVGAGIAALSALCLIIAWRKRLGPFRRKASKEGDTYDKAELHGDHKPWVEAMEKERVELDAATGTHEAMDKERSELETVENVHELKGSNEVGVAEVYGIDQMHELPGHDDGVRVADEGARTY